ncbi:MAG: hypothetical protein AVDCRST_MAG26-3888 [uncultured Chloroflexia bacterium]|uniref:Uncharacterized protein n=1 Tax=uncultured Chloroflexia bacterium TaxID=1672391 RepID=A0A6J4JV36_9CHLR|nr:MAG: hypothetical protein AVDCRST_MAG26-3888 [uncultured Chloroflexia bacterium]
MHKTSCERFKNAGFAREDINVMANNARDQYELDEADRRNERGSEAGEGAGFGATGGAVVGGLVALLLAPAIPSRRRRAGTECHRRW